MDNPNISIGQLSTEYETLHVDYVTVGNPIEQVLPPDPRRWYVRFDTASFSGFSNGLFPAPQLGGSPAFTQMGTHLEYFYRDAPSIVTGAWYIYGAAPGSQIHATICVFIR